MGNNDNRLAFDLANEVMSVVSEKKPSIFVPFRGKLPILEEWQEKLYYDEVTKPGVLMKDLPDWVQDIIYKGLKVAHIDRDFQTYLRDNNLFQEFQKMDSSDKSTELVRFLNANCLSLEYLTIN